MRSRKSIPFPSSSKRSAAKPQTRAASARRRGLAFTLAILAESRSDAVEHEVYEQREIEQHLRLRLV